MKIIFYILLLFPAFCLGQAPGQLNDQISIGTKKTIYSNILNEDREIWVYMPEAGRADSKTQYPVMYLLDGKDFFHFTTGIVSELSALGKMPKMIVVGIVNKDRGSDFTPTHSLLARDGTVDADFKNSGRGEKFTSFLQKELIPFINSHYSTAPFRMFVGHSLGGLAVLNSLINHPSLFNAYVAIDPSLWWDNHLIMKQAQNVLTQKDYADKSLYFASSNTMEKGMDTVRVIIDTAYGNGNVRNNFQFREILKKSKNLQWAWKFYPEDNHSSVPLISEYDAFRSIFKKYEMDKDISDTSITVEYIKDHYHTVSAMLQYAVSPPQNIVNILGYIALGNKTYDKAYSFFKLNIDNYPASSNVYDSLGDFYVETNDQKKALEAFKKALSLMEVPETRKKLEKLQAKK
ncbi:MAG TPA: alpha/beta hydrolase-fold protein [Daejeonella sp.]|nr:alpha/beta hydrolase-fold protein [Daejeonella sp.]